MNPLEMHQWPWDMWPCMVNYKKDIQMGPGCEYSWVLFGGSGEVPMTDVIIRAIYWPNKGLLAPANRAHADIGSS